jgi:NAD-dependent histone deacetylase SIR2
LLGLAISRELSKRLKLPFYNTIDDAVGLLKKSRNIIVLTGAGISTSLGIPDFRSDHGLYNLVKERGLDINDPQEVFDIEKFKEDPTIFFSVAKDILPSTEKYTPTHAFIELLQRKGKLLTNYTQNIDNIEAAAGILPEKIVQCHGSFATATCRDCHYKVPGETIFPDIKAGRIPRCIMCTAALRAELGNKKKRKRSSSAHVKKRRRGSDSDDDDDGQYDMPEAGIMKPDITFFGEALPNVFSDRLTNHDKNIVDLVIVIGTSLKVAPVSEVVPYLPPHIPQMYISMTPVSHVNFDIDMMGEADVVVSELCRRAGWELKHEMIPADEKVEVKLAEGYPSRHIFTSNKKKK